MAENVAMSTGWNHGRHDCAREIVDEIRGFGIDCLEAGYSLNTDQLEQMVGLLRNGEFRVNSVHNFCPTPAHHKCKWGDDFLLSSLDAEERKSGLEATRQTIAWAERLQAKVVVVHLGRVMMDRGPYDKIKRLLAEGAENGPEHREAVRELKRERKRLAGPFFDAVRRTLDDVLACLPGGIRLGIECRYEYFAIPNLEEMARLLDEYPGIGYWHDIGHAHVQETMGFYERAEYIRALQHGLIGFHIHDSLKISDHRAPGYGEIDFDALLKPYLRDELLKVLEFHPRVTPGEAADGIRFLREKGVI